MLLALSAGPSGKPSGQLFVACGSLIVEDIEGEIEDAYPGVVVRLERFAHIPAHRDTNALASSVGAIAYRDLEELSAELLADGPAGAIPDEIILRKLSYIAISWDEMSLLGIVAGRWGRRLISPNVDRRGGGSPRGRVDWLGALDIDGGSDDQGAGGEDNEQEEVRGVEEAASSLHPPANFEVAMHTAFAEFEAAWTGVHAACVAELGLTFAAARELDAQDEAELNTRDADDAVAGSGASSSSGPSLAPPPLPPPPLPLPGASSSSSSHEAPAAPADCGRIAASRDDLEGSLGISLDFQRYNASYIVKATTEPQGSLGQIYTFGANSIKGVCKRAGHKQCICWVNANGDWLEAFKDVAAWLSFIHHEAGTSLTGHQTAAAFVKQKYRRR